MNRTVLEGVLIHQTIEVVLEVTGEFTRLAGAGAIKKPRRALSAKAMHPLSHRRVSEVEAVGDCLHAGAFDHFAHGLGAPKEPCFFGFFQEGIQLGQGIISKLKIEVTHEGVAGERPQS